MIAVLEVPVVVTASTPSVAPTTANGTFVKEPKPSASASASTAHPPGHNAKDKEPTELEMAKAAVKEAYEVRGNYFAKMRHRKEQLTMTNPGAPQSRIEELFGGCDIEDMAAAKKSFNPSVADMVLVTWMCPEWLQDLQRDERF